VFRGDEAGKGHEPGRGRKAPGIAEFGGDGQRGEVVDAPEAAEAFDAGAQGLEREEIAQFQIDGLAAGQGFVDGADVGAVRLFEGRERPLLRLQPLGVPFGPGALGARETPAVTEEEFGEPVTSAEEIDANIFSAPKQVARGFFLLGGNVNRGERAGAKQNGQVVRIAAIGLDAIAGAPRNQGGGDDIAWDRVRGEGALQVEATGTGLVATMDGAMATETFDELQHGPRVGAQGV
jgi:hypothetical protein